MKIGFPKIKRTMVLSFLDNICEILSNLVFLIQTFFICLEFGFLYVINYDETERFENFIKQLASLNIFYVKIFQSICNNNYLLNDKQIEFLLFLMS